MSAGSRWLIAWVGGAAIGVANGVAREVGPARVLSEQRANQLSALSAIGLFGLYFTALQRRWPLRDRSEALRVGAAWLLLTTGFELGFGRMVAKRSWCELGEEYELQRGRLWPLVLAWLAVGPELVRERASGD